MGFRTDRGRNGADDLTFLDSLDFTGKTIIPFNTHEGSGQSGTVEEIREEVKGVSVDDGIAIQGKTAQENEEETRNMLEQWLEEMGLTVSP